MTNKIEITNTNEMTNKNEHDYEKGRRASSLWFLFCNYQDRNKSKITIKIKI